jgi:hypothetical protein
MDKDAGKYEIGRAIIALEATVDKAIDDIAEVVPHLKYKAVMEELDAFLSDAQARLSELSGMWNQAG